MFISYFLDGVFVMDMYPPSVKREFDIYFERTKRSGEVYKLVKPLIPYGVNSNYRALEPYPLYFRGGRGSRLYDADGNEYIDFNLAFGVLVTGHMHPRLMEAVEERIRDGVILGFEYENIYKLGDIVCRRFNLDMVRFSSTGLEATLHAIRVARAYTGRNKVVKFLGNYHGSHDFMLVATKPNKFAVGHYRYPSKVPSGPGVSHAALSEVLVAQYGDIESVEGILGRYGDDVAAIILEPVAMNMGLIVPSKDFMTSLRRLCDDYGIVLIYDEVKTCGKYYGGAEEFFGVEPDLKTLGKAIAGGFPLSIIGGRREIMENYGPGKVPHAGTFNSNPLSIEAGIVTLDEILTRDMMDKTIKLNEALVKGYIDVFTDKGIDHYVTKFGNSGSIYFTGVEIRNWHDFLRYQHIGRWWVFFVSMLNRGIVASAPGYDEQWTVGVQHSIEDIDRTVEALGGIAHLLLEDIPNIKIVEAF
jgi:glutamate-1-semialdehyde 2,1-aminomutase